MQLFATFVKNESNFFNFLVQQKLALIIILVRKCTESQTKTEKSERKAKIDKKRFPYLPNVAKRQQQSFYDTRRPIQKFGANTSK